MLGSLREGTGFEPGGRSDQTYNRGMSGQTATIVGQPAPDVTLQGEDGRDIKLSDIWAQGPVAFVFIRHFG